MYKKLLFLLFLLCSTVPIIAQQDSTATKPIRRHGMNQSKGQKPSKMKKEVDLNEVVVKGVAKKLILKADTFIYNSDAYKTPEGSTIEELVRRLPGATIDDSGNITINGKTVKKIMVDGKEFMTGDTKTALKNLPTSIVEKVKAYDEKSDMAKMTGVDDGEEQTVLDFGIKQGMNKGMMTNIDLAIGTKNTYAERAMGAYMKSDSRLMIFGNANNTGDRGFMSGGRGGFGGGQSGLRANKMIAMNYNYEKKDKLKIDIFGRWNHDNTDLHNITNSENFVSTVKSLGNSDSQSYSRSNQWNIGGRLEWQIDSLTKLLVRPSYSNGSTDNRSRSENETLNGDSIMLNNQLSNGVSYSTSNSFNFNATISRKLSSNGRNITFQGRYSTSNTADDNLSRSFVNLSDSAYFTNRYIVSPIKNWSFRTDIAYMEPIAKATFIQLRYRYEYSNKKNDRGTYVFDNVADFFQNEIPDYRSFDNYLNPYCPIDSYRSDSLSRSSEYDNYKHEIELSLKRTTAKYNLNVGLLLQPQISRLTYHGLGCDTITTRTVSNFTPTLDFRYKWNNRKTLRINYRGSSSMPSMTDMLPVTDNSDPLNITMGNPALQPSFTNSLRFNYNNYVSRHMRAIMAFLNYQNTRNSVSNKVTYNETTGGKITQPENINGNWNIEGAFMINTALDSVGIWNFNSFSNVSYQNYANYAYIQDTKTTEENYTRSTNLNERLSGSWRKDWIEVELNGQVQYTISRNKLQPTSNLDTWNFQYGTDITLNLPWSMSLSTGAHMTSRRGYSEESMNTNEFIWNAQIAQSFLKGKALTVSLQFNDILQQKSSLTRTINAIQRKDSWTNDLNSYCMVHVIYRFNSFGGKNRRGPFGDHGPGDRRGGPGGPPPGGFHGGPPPGAPM